MKSVPKFIRRFIILLLFSSLLLLFVNIAAMFIIGANQMSNQSPWITADETSKGLLKTGTSYSLSDKMKVELTKKNAWAILIDNDTKTVVWHTDNLPQGIPLKYSLSDVASITRGYVNDYPTFTGKNENGLVVLGFPKTSYWKLLWPSWDYKLIANSPKIILAILVSNVLAIFFIYIIANAKLIGSVTPIVEGIQALSKGKLIHVKEKGVLSELASNLNHTSEILQIKDKELKKKETARANWIAGVSHDIRTPLSMVMGYAGQLESNSKLTADEHQKAAVIRRQSERIKNLINDLNLASKLEYNMQPLNLKKINVISLVRQVVVDFMNMDIDGQNPIEWMTDDETLCSIDGDAALLKRAVSNLIQNSINHNKTGCHIYVTVEKHNAQCLIRVEDDGIGASDEQLETLNNTPHYMVCDENTMNQRHGLGLLIVKQIAEVHGGSVIIDHSKYGGFSVTIALFSGK